jgi:hypothetical protein
MIFGDRVARDSARATKYEWLDRRRRSMINNNYHEVLRVNH